MLPTKDINQTDHCNTLGATKDARRITGHSLRSNPSVQSVLQTELIVQQLHGGALTDVDEEYFPAQQQFYWMIFCYLCFYDGYRVSLIGQEDLVVNVHTQM